MVTQLVDRTEKEWRSTDHACECSSFNGLGATSERRTNSATNAQALRPLCWLVSRRFKAQVPFSPDHLHISCSPCNIKSYFKCYWASEIDAILIGSESGICVLLFDMFMMVSTDLCKQIGNIHWVQANLPTSLGNLESLPINPTDYLNHAVCITSIKYLACKMWTYLSQGDISYVFPGPLDITRLKDALSKTLSHYPHCAGRASRDPRGPEWSILLNNKGVPITVSTTEHNGIFKDASKQEAGSGSWAPINDIDMLITRKFA